MHTQSTVAANPLTVAAIHLFQHIPSEISNTIASRLRVRHLEVGEEAVSPDEIGESVCFVLSGTIRVAHISRSGREVILVERHNGELVGLFEQNSLSNSRLRITATASSCVAFMNCGELIKILQQHPDLLERILAHGLQFSRGLCDRLIELATLKVRHRIFAELLRISGGERGEAEPLVISPAPRHSELATRVISQREAVTRELGRLEKAGIIRRFNGAIKIIEPDYLRDAIRRAC